jgi:hypothetical protein
VDLVDLAGLTVSEAAAALARVRLHRAHNRLRKTVTVNWKDMDDTEAADRRFAGLV